MMVQVLSEVKEKQDWKEVILAFTAEHQYVISHIDIWGACGDSIGELTLRNILTNEIDCFEIWIGDEDLSLDSFYVCIPTSVDEDLNEVCEVYYLGDSPIPTEYYSNLEWTTE